MGKPKFNKCELYVVELYPTREIDNAIYLGESENIHLFEARTRFIFFDEHWMIESSGRITYHEFSSAPVMVLLKEDLKKSESKESPLVKILQGVIS